MKKGFTLIELLMVVSIMAFLGVASASGYSALTRGMKERGAIAAASAALRSAKERALIDRAPTAVVYYNKTLKLPSDDENAIVVGVMTSIKRSGRITKTQGDLLYDEFADLEMSYINQGVSEVDELIYEPNRLSDPKQCGGMRLYKFGNKSETGKYSIVADTPFLEEEYQPMMLKENANGSVSWVQGTNVFLISAYVLQDKATATWKVGDAYGFEFSEIQLPHGFVFRDCPISSQIGAGASKTIYFNPEKIDESQKLSIGFSVSDGSGGVGGNVRDVGEASANEEDGV